ncbi:MULTISPECIES: glycosyltransferase family 4 protein [unclassified Arthrobacter]|uniref:glycosyltransferase family 4 protein n=1 Tax=unclassified Arthrobacter TaxID=235627 RepID=UPI001CFFBDA6|nr:MULTISPECIES: glycosyltransferase family 4 protein [unclassified Arthrobacter]MCB5281633.1 2-deoxystreptamine glucosyltransferase [Arthrobacter sp. ES1]WGZ78432.1 glycosyltransferase family 4 protein [Arthrobacter sp. EM1]
MGGNAKMLVVSQHFWPEGFRINDICDYLVENDVDIEVLCGLPNYPKGELFPGYTWRGPYKEKHDGLTIYRAPEIPRGNNSNWRILVNYLSFPVASLLHLPRLMFGKYDKIFLYQLSPVMMTIAGLILSKVRKIESTMYVLDLWPENLFSVLKIKNKFLRLLVERVSHWHYRQADNIIVLSEQMRGKIQGITGLPDAKITVVPQACERLYEQEIHDPELAERLGNGFKVVFTGNISPAQSFETIIDAAETLKSEGLTDISWVIVGDGMSRSSVQGEIALRGLDDEFIFEGHHPVSDIPKYTTLADVLVGCLVKSELLEATIPAKVMSYIASGRPVVLAMDGEVRNLVEDQAQCGLVGPAGNSSTLADNVRSLHALTPEQRRELGARGKAYHLAHLQRTVVLKRLKDFIFNEAQTR